MKIIITFLLGLCSFFSFASHSIGGTVSWQNVGVGQFVFELKLIHKCYGSAVTPISLRQLESPLGQIPVELKRATGYTPNCESASGIWCNSTSTSNWVLTSMVYRSDTITITGTPPATGWKFYYRDNDRPSSTVNIQVAANVQTEVYGIMYPEAVTHNLSSPTFVDTYDESITPYNHLVSNMAFTSQNKDSLYYRLVPSITGSGTSYSYNSGFDYQNPFPSQANNAANGASSFNPFTGAINTDVQVATEGYYACAVVVEQWGVGAAGHNASRIKVSEVVKDYMVPIITSSASSANAAPTASIDTSVYKDVIKVSSSSYLIEAEVGDTINFQIQGFDGDLDANFQPQTVTFEAQGVALDSSWGGWESFMNVPALTPLQTGFTSTISVGVNFQWEISADMVDSVNAYHMFNFSFIDNNCDFMGRTSVNLAVRVKAKTDTTSGGVGINEIAQSQVKVFPNPTSAFFTIQGLVGKSQIQILDVQGKLVEAIVGLESSVEVTRKDWPAGLYFVKIKDENNTTIKKLYCQ